MRDRKTIWSLTFFRERLSLKWVGQRVWFRRSRRNDGNRLFIPACFTTELLLAVCFLGYRCLDVIQLAACMNRTNTRVLIVSCEVGPEAWWHQAEMLKEAFPKNDPS